MEENSIISQSSSLHCSYPAKLYTRPLQGCPNAPSPHTAHTWTRCPLEFSAKVSHLLSHSYRVSVVFLAPCGRKCLVSLMASSKDPSIYPVVLQARGASFVCPVRLSVESEWTSQDVHAVKFNFYGKIQY